MKTGVVLSYIPAHTSHSGILLKCSSALVSLGGTQDSAFLTGSPVMLVPLVCGPHLV